MLEMSVEHFRDGDTPFTEFSTFLKKEKKGREAKREEKKRKRQIWRASRGRERATWALDGEEGARLGSRRGARKEATITASGGGGPVGAGAPHAGPSKPLEDGDDAGPSSRGIIGRAGGAPEAGGAQPEARAVRRRGRPRGAAATGDADVSAAVRSVARDLLDGRLPTLYSDRNTGQDRRHDGFWRSLTGAQRARSVLAVRERAGSAAEGWADQRVMSALQCRMIRARKSSRPSRNARFAPAAGFARVPSRRAGVGASVGGVRGGGEEGGQDLG